MEHLIVDIKEALKNLFQIEAGKELQIQRTRKEFKGDYSINVFPWVKQVRKSPDEMARLIGDYLIQNNSNIESYEVIKGFLNITLTNNALINSFISFSINIPKPSLSLPEKILIEFSSPNTNKPLHLGHIRNNLLGDSITKILASKPNNQVIKVNLVNDRGIHICKSMLAWKKWGNNITPSMAGKKGDKLVGDFYVLFDKEYKKQVNELIEQGFSLEEAEKKAPLILEAQEMLQKWEQDDIETRQLWKKMNEWVYKGFEDTYAKLGIQFDKIYYESETYQLGKKYVLEGLDKGLFYKKDDGSVWVDLKDNGLDEKLLLRADGTSVYITQDIGTAILRYKEYMPDKMIYVVGNEQIYHFQVLKLVLKKLGFDWADKIHHLSYGMVELPEGKMKSREGTVVDADDLIEELNIEAKKISNELGKLKDEDPNYIEKATQTIALAALKYYILKVDPEKNMLFNPKESIDFDGNTGPFILYTYTRIQSLIRKAKELNIDFNTPSICSLNDKEKEIIKMCLESSNILDEAIEKYSPARIANYVYALCKEYNQFYQQYPIIKEENIQVRNLRLTISDKVAEIIKYLFSILGINVIDKM